jgi:predicted alpha/beta superfamily hydrolase
MRMNTFALLLSAHLVATLPVLAFAQDAPRAVSVPGTEVHEFRATNGTLFDLYVALPADYVGDGSVEYPIFYMTDASVGFAATVQAYRMMTLGGELPPMILIGIDRANPSLVNWYVGRTLDLTPTSVPEADREDSAFLGGVEVSSGGADIFLKILTEEIIPWTEARYPESPERGIGGYSLGGLFATYALFESPQTFTHYLIGSPSLWWDDEVMFRRAESYFAASDDLKARVFMSAGSMEGTMLPDMLRMAEALKAQEYEGLDLESHIFIGETHLSGVIPATIRGLRSLFGPR